MTQNKPLGPPWTVLKILEWTTQFFEKKNLDSPRLDAEILLANVLKLERVMLYANFDRPMEDLELATYKKAIKRRGANEPIAYITGTRGFWNFDFIVDSRVLIPRPDTERLVEIVLERIKPTTLGEGKIVDVGTGSGAIAVCLKSECLDAEVIGVDISEDALDVARENAKTIGFDVDFKRSDLLQSCEGPFDIVVSNPPYVSEKDKAILSADIIEHEPHLALFAEDGLAIYRRLIPDAFSKLKSGGFIALEIGYDQGSKVVQLCSDSGFINVELAKDYGDNERVVSAFKP